MPLTQAQRYLIYVTMLQVFNKGNSDGFCETMRSALWLLARQGRIPEEYEYDIHLLDLPELLMYQKVEHGYWWPRNWYGNWKRRRALKDMIKQTQP